MKTVVVTGADGNLGTAVTREFLKEGYQVIATVINEQAKKKIKKHSRLDVQVVNLTNENETADFIKAAIKKYKQIHAALLLVGGFAMGDIPATTGADLKKMYSLNFETAFFTTRPLLAHMKQKGTGRIIFVGARPAIKPDDAKNMIAYALSKSLLFNLAEYINADTKGTNVTATVVVPSTLDTAINREAMPKANPANWVKPDDIAAIMQFICGSNSQALRESIFKIYNNA
ncbi:MAG: SDR family NAD(P)-dependent oxidoreductase [Bacteroidetes bacterium]|nr:SDR family NAD(P)-dependent oxidoreductase [Bacteroidota bacterium]